MGNRPRVVAIFNLYANDSTDDNKSEHSEINSDYYEEINSDKNGENKRERPNLIDELHKEIIEKEISKN